MVPRTLPGSLEKCASGHFCKMFVSCLFRGVWCKYYWVNCFSVL